MPAIRIRRFFPLFLLMASAVLAIPAALADDSVYQVNGVAVDETADDEVEAKARGIANGKQKAFQQLLERLTLPEARSSVPQPDQAMLEQMIYALSIASEKMSRGQGRYLARINVGFHPDAVRDWLQRNHVTYVETPSKKLVILPIMQEGQVVRLWEDGNSWFRGWGQMVLETGLVPVVLPLGDLSDLSTISTADALNGDRERLQAIADKYGADGVLLTVARLTTNTDGRLQRLSITSNVFAAGWSESALTHAVAAAEGESAVDVLGRGARLVLSAVEDDWKRRNMIDYSGAHQKLVVSAPLQSLNDWVRLRDVLERLAAVDGYALEALSTSEAIVALDYVGTTEQLQTALAQADLVLQFDQAQQRWLLARR